LNLYFSAPSFLCSLRAVSVFFFFFFFFAILKVFFLSGCYVFQFCLSVYYLFVNNPCVNRLIYVFIVTFFLPGSANVPCFVNPLIIRL
jgi:hypothetical protein